MSPYSIKHLEGVSELRRYAAAWDDLWQRSEITLPTARAELLAIWWEHFADGRPLHAVVVEQDGRAVAALPLIAGRWKCFRAAVLPGNAWSPSGDLLLDEHCEHDGVLDALLDGLRALRGSVLSCDAVPAGAGRWRAFQTALTRRGLIHSASPRFSIDLVQVENSWDEYLAGRAASHRRHLRKSLHRAEQCGSLELVRHDALLPEQIDPLLRTCFEIEASGWKGAANSAVLRVPRVREFYERQARQLAELGQLSINVLRSRGEPIGFEYGWRAKRVYCSLKVGYDEQFSRLSPGQLLRYLFLEQAFANRELNCLDFLGPTSPATSRWANDQYAIDRLIVSWGGVLSRSAVDAYRRTRPLVRKARRYWSRRAAPAASPSRSAATLDAAVPMEA